jgi:hypothetical protein
VEFVPLVQHLAAVIATIDHQVATSAINYTAAATTLDIALANAPHIMLSNEQAKEILTSVLVGTTVTLTSDTIKNAVKSISSLTRNQLVASAEQQLAALQRKREVERSKLHILFSQESSDEKVAVQITKKIVEINKHVERTRKFMGLLSASPNPSNAGLAVPAFN